MRSASVARCPQHHIKRPNPLPQQMTGAVTAERHVRHKDMSTIFDIIGGVLVSLGLIISFIMVYKRRWFVRGVLIFWILIVLGDYFVEATRGLAYRDGMSPWQSVVALGWLLGIFYCLIPLGVRAFVSSRRSRKQSPIQMAIQPQTVPKLVQPTPLRVPADD